MNILKTKNTGEWEAATHSKRVYEKKKRTWMWTLWIGVQKLFRQRVFSFLSAKQEPNKKKKEPDNIPCER